VWWHAVGVVPKAYLIDMDGVRIKGRQSNSLFTPRDHQARLRAMGLDIPAASIFTSALATAHFLQQRQLPS
jgi:ribonucleotide monophosphatase NagD (HAD superfamily)